MTSKAHSQPLWDPAVLKMAVIESFKKLSPKNQIRNPVMFTVYIGCLLTTGLFLHAIFGEEGDASTGFILEITVWLWLTLLFANFAEAIAEGRGKAQASTLRKSRLDVLAKRLSSRSRDAKYEIVPATHLRAGDVVLIEAGDVVPSDGEAIEGIASVNESAITGESAPVIRESGGDRSAVTGGTQVISDWLVMEVTANPGETFLDHMIELIEGTKRQKTPNELALTIMLSGQTIVFLLVCVTLQSFSVYSYHASGLGTVVSITVLAALFVCLAPTTIGGLLSAIGIAGMDRMIQANVIALSGRAVESAGDVNVLILDKTGTVTLGNRQATDFFPAEDVKAEVLADAAQLSSLADETPEGRSIVILAKEKYNLRGRALHELGATFIPFTAQTRMSGANLAGRQIRKGAAQAVETYLHQMGGTFPPSVRVIVDNISRKGSNSAPASPGTSGCHGR